jgi:hypothetical protein
MLNFRKMRKRKQQSERVFEKGFLAADCGEMAPEDINYFQLYSPDVERKDDLPCHYVLNETVLLYSHDHHHLRNFGFMMNDYMNIWMMLWLSGLSKYSKDISLLHLDSFIPGKKGAVIATGDRQQQQQQYPLDHTNQFFKVYNISFRRIIRGIDFPNDARVCFKRIILPIKPLLSLSENAYVSLNSNNPEDYSCSPTIQNSFASGIPFISSLFQRWNLQIRSQLSLLTPTIPDNFLTSDRLTVVLLTRSLQNLPSTSAYYLSKLIQNQEELVQELKIYLASSTATKGVTIQLEIVSDLFKLPFEEQIKKMSSTGLIIGMTGSTMANSIFMPVGTRYCCGMIEIFPETTSGGEAVSSPRNLKGNRQLAKRLGHIYHRLDLPGTAKKENDNNHKNGTVIPLKSLKEAVAVVVDQILSSTGSCVLPEVIRQPYF